MANNKWISAACVALLSATLAAAQATASPQAASRSAQSGKQRAPDKPSATNAAAKAPQEATLTGCVTRDAANGGQATIASNGIAYKLTGRPDKDFEQYLGKRVEVTGALTTGSTAARATSGNATSGNSVTRDSAPPKGQTATAGQSDVTATGTPRDNTVPSSLERVPLATDRGTTADLTGRMQVKTLRLISPSCL